MPKGVPRLSHSDDRWSSPTAKERDNDKNHCDYNQHMSNPRGFPGDAKRPQCLGYQGNNKKDEGVFEHHPIKRIAAMLKQKTEKKFVAG